MRIRSLIPLLVLAPLLGCGLFGHDEDGVRQAYQSYREAMLSANLTKLKTLVARDKARELDAPNAAELLQMAAELYPEGTQVAAVQVSGNAATLQLSGRMQGGTAKGNVQLVKENGAWKVSKEDWQVQITLGADTEPGADAGPVAAAEPQLPADAEPAPLPVAPAVARPSADGATGAAEVVLDGVAQTYALYGGFASDTRFADPRRATIQFKPESWNNGSAGLRLTLDATATGRHYADGKAIHDMMFNRGQVQVGQDGGSGRAAVLQWIADGGQVFPPKAGCAIEVTSAYSGQPDSVFQGRISGCTVHSAGIDRQLASVTFAMHGAPAR